MSSYGVLVSLAISLGTNLVRKTMKTVPAAKATRTKTATAVTAMAVPEPSAEAVEGEEGEESGGLMLIFGCG